MSNKPASVSEYLASLPEDRRAALEAVRRVILKNLDKDYEEGMQYGMIGYYVPHRVYPAGYHCDPKQPLPFAALASQKSHMAIYMMGLYLVPAEDSRFREAWAKTGKKLDMGKSCLRFKKLEDVALEVVGEAIRRMPAKAYIKVMEKQLSAREAERKPASAKGAKKAGKKVGKTAASTAGKKKVARRA